MPAINPSIDSWNYLRIRGEEFTKALASGWEWELPPHTRRRGSTCSQLLSPCGITSAYAEKRLLLRSSHDHEWNYLRIRGEEHRQNQLHQSKVELPPHTRRRVGNRTIERVIPGITSAYAEKSGYSALANRSRWNYLRIRGEEFVAFCPPSLMPELPPHTRRRGSSLHRKARALGITSAYAEKSLEPGSTSLP